MTQQSPTWWTDVDPDEILARASAIAADRMAALAGAKGAFDPDAVRELLTHYARPLQHEVFGVLWLDVQKRVIVSQVLFRGTLSEASVFPREVVKEALYHNAHSGVIWHNHPSGAVEPSTADKVLTRRLKDALDLVGVSLLDHMITGKDRALSFAEQGLL